MGILPVSDPGEGYATADKGGIIQVGIHPPLLDPVLHLLHGGDRLRAVESTGTGLIVVSIDQVGTGRLQDG